MARIVLCVYYKMHHTRKNRSSKKNKSRGLKHKSKGSKKGTPKVNKRKLRGGLFKDWSFQSINPFETRKSLEENKKVADSFINEVDGYYKKYFIDEYTRSVPIAAQPKMPTLTKLINIYTQLPESSLKCPDIECKGKKYAMIEELYDSGNKLRYMLDQNNKNPVVGSEKYNDYVRIGSILDAKTKKYNDILGEKTKPLTPEEVYELHKNLESTGVFG